MAFPALCAGVEEYSAGRRRVLLRGGRSLSIAAALIACALAKPAHAAGTWTAAPINPGVGQAFGLWLLTDGRVISHGTALNHWVVLTPDAKGSYANGTWKSVASSAYARGGAQEHVLKDGRFFEAGGEYIYAWPTGGSSSDYNTVEIYDPIANTWTLEAPGLYGDIGDTGSAMLADGRVFDSTRNSSATQIYDPVANKWTATANSPLGSGDENAWAALQNGGILAVGYNTAGAAVYNPATNKWTKTTVPAGFKTGDTAGISQMFDGRVIAYGLGQNYIYTPGATAADAGTWALGPKMLNGDEAEDEFSDTLPNGMVWAGLTAVQFGPGVILQQFDPTTNTVSSATPPPDTGNPYPIGYLNLPNGQVMVTAASRDWLYTPDTQPDDSWRPTVTSVTYDSGSKTYTLTGTQISGLINGGDEGDDMTMSENYPIVWLKATSGNVYYCRSFNFSNMMPSKGSAPETAQFTTPAGLPDGSYDLYVSAVGVQSKTAYPFTTGMSGPTTGGGGTGGTGAGGAGSGTAGSGSGGTGTGTGTGGTSSGVAGSSSGGTANGGTDAGTAGSGSSVAGASTGSGGTTGSGGSGVASAGAAGTISLVGTAGNKGTGSAGSNGSTGTAGSSDGSQDSGGCSCSTLGKPVSTSGWASFGALGLLGLVMRGRRRRARG